MTAWSVMITSDVWSKRFAGSWTLTALIRDSITIGRGSSKRGQRAGAWPAEEHQRAAYPKDDGVGHLALAVMNTGLLGALALLVMPNRSVVKEKRHKDVRCVEDGSATSDEIEKA